MSCAVFGCNQNKRDKRKLYRFPHDLNCQKVWLHKCKRDDKVNLDTARICEIHFSSTQKRRSILYELSTFNKPKNFRDLKEDAVPDINLPSGSLQKPTTSDDGKKTSWIRPGL